MRIVEKNGRLGGSLVEVSVLITLVTDIMILLEAIEIFKNSSEY